MGAEIGAPEPAELGWELMPNKAPGQSQTKSLDYYTLQYRVIYMEDMSASKKHLKIIRDTQESVRTGIQSHYSAPFLMLWGVLWSIAYLLTYWFLTYVILIWGVTAFAGISLSVLLWRRIINKGPIHFSESARFPTLQMVAGWVFAGAMLVILAPLNGIQFNAIMTLSATYSLFIFGQSFRNNTIIGTSIVAASATLLIYQFATPQNYSLMMALIAGPSLIGGGLIQIFNRKTA
jgi:hypothetical protein